MKIKKIFALILALATMLCAVVIPANAKDAEAHDHVEIIIAEENISEETRARIIEFYTNGGEENEGTATYGLTCTLLGHKIETYTVSSIAHKVRSSSPRCLKKTYNYEICSRCDYEKSTLASQKYIICC